MIKVHLFIVILLVIGCGQDSPPKEAPSLKRNIVIRYAGFAANTPLPITCDLFDWGVFSKKDTIIIEDGSDEYLTLERLLKKFVIDSSIVSINTRIKISYVEDTICLDKFGNYYSKNKGGYMRNDSLTTFIYKKIGWFTSP